VLIYLAENQCDNAIKSMTRKKLAKELHLSINTIIVATNEFCKSGYIKEGMLDHKAKTYFITHQGMNFIKEVLQ
jgi:predicted transcriptional regulator